ncbi:TetR/AcrR family transcriptional regulator [Catenovulum sediminis]|uniref:TetR family transcriptional regulator n=1 Tax=Catenovulum sediminis TaxID=1740262 RepID=A0ABV1RFU4_9ALTE|nr:TetR family transcriptional regulator [Catenovulum sediminis]
MLKSAKRARSAEDKSLKRDLILNTASQLFDDSPDTLPTAAAIANHSGIAKGTVYLYFKSKEEIFLALLEQHYQAWFSDIRSAITADKPDSDEIINALCHYIESQPQFFQLASLSSSIIEQNVDSKILLEFKKRLVEIITSASKDLAQRLDLDEYETCAQLLMRSYAMLLGLWQVSHPPEKVAKTLDNPNLTLIQPEFGLEARDALAQLWHGYVGQKGAKSSGRFWKIGNLFAKTE